MSEIIRIDAQASDAGKRTDRFLSERMPDFSRSRIQKLIEEGMVLCGDGTPRDSMKLRGTENFIVTVPDPENYDVVPENIPLDIVYEDEDIAVVNKPVGMVVHPAPGNYSGTLVNALLYHFQGSLSGINGVMRPGIVHRIDKDTSGLLMICKSDRAHREMAEKLKTHDIERVYHAIVYGNIKEEEGTVNAPLDRDRNDRKKMAIVPGGREAVTHFRVLERFGELTYIEARLETGRTHQIRVHMKSLGHPLLGDPVYGPGTISGGVRKLLQGVREDELQGQLLIAKVLGFVHPVSGTFMHFECPLTPVFQHILEAARSHSGQ